MLVDLAGLVALLVVLLIWTVALSAIWSRRPARACAATLVLDRLLTSVELLSGRRRGTA